MGSEEDEESLSEEDAAAMADLVKGFAGEGGKMRGHMLDCRMSNVLRISDTYVCDHTWFAHCVITWPCFAHSSLVLT